MLKLRKKSLPWIPLHFADFLASVDGLTNDEAFGYMRLVIHFWMHGPLVNNKVLLDRIARTDSALIVDMFFHKDGDGKLFPPDFAELKAQAIENGKQNTARTAKATEAAKRLRNGSITENLSVTETDGDGDGDGDSEKESDSDPNPDPNRPSSVTEKFIQKFGKGSPLTGTERPPSGRDTPQTFVTEPSRITITNSAGQRKVYNISPGTIAGLRDKFPTVDIYGLIADMRDSKYPGENFPSEGFIKQHLESKAGELAQEKTGVAA